MQKWMIVLGRRSMPPKTPFRHPGDPANPVAAGQFADDRRYDTPLAGAAVRREHLNVREPIDHASHHRR
jgi:hypothetical protein